MFKLFWFLGGIMSFICLLDAGGAFKRKKSDFEIWQEEYKKNKLQIPDDYD